MKIFKTSEVKCQHIFSLIAGPSGSGKTYTLGTLPEESTVILSLENGLLSINDKNFEAWEISSVSDLIEAFNEIKKGKFKNCAVDSLTELSDMVFSELRPQFTKSQTFALYNTFTEKMTSIIKSFRDLTEVNTWFTVLTKEVDTGVSLDLAQKSLGTRIPAYFDFIFYVKCFEKEDKILRALSTDNSLMPFCKSRSSKLDIYEKPNLSEIIKKVLE